MQKHVARLFVTGLFLAGFAANPGSAKESKPEEREAPAAFKDLVACRQIAENAARLACYDRQVASLDQAQSQGDLVVADRKQVKEAQRDLFGYSIPKSNLLGTDKEEPISQLEAVIASVRQAPRGGWRLVLENGSVWDQIDTEVLAVDPRSGGKVVIKRAAFGSYQARINGQPPIKVRRVQ